MLIAFEQRDDGMLQLMIALRRDELGKLENSGVIKSRIQDDDDSHDMWLTILCADEDLELHEALIKHGVIRSDETTRVQRPVQPNF